jgi:hypothetical protein
VDWSGHFGIPVSPRHLKTGTDTVALQWQPTRVRARQCGGDRRGGLPAGISPRYPIRCDVWGVDASLALSLGALRGRPPFRSRSPPAV